MLFIVLYGGVCERHVRIPDQVEVLTVVTYAHTGRKERERERERPYVERYISQRDALAEQEVQETFAFQRFERGYVRVQVSVPESLPPGRISHDQESAVYRTQYNGCNLN